MTRIYSHELQTLLRAHLTNIRLRFIYVNSGTLFNVVLAPKDAYSCAGQKLSVIPTKAECQAAVTMLKGRAVAVRALPVSRLPYCGIYDGSYVFDMKGVRELRGINYCSSRQSRCVCKQGEMPWLLVLYNIARAMHTVLCCP